MIRNPSARKYLRRVRRMLPGVGKMKKEMMNMATCDISAFLQEQPEADYETIESRFGKPEAIAASYVENMGTAEILKKLRIRRWIMTVVLIVLAIIAIVWSVYIVRALIYNWVTSRGYLVIS